MLRSTAITTMCRAAPSGDVATIGSTCRLLGISTRTRNVPSGDTFGFSADAEVSSTDSARGFSTTAGLVGGRLVGMVTT